MGDTWVNEQAYDDQADKEVRSWFERAKSSGHSHINLYYAPNHRAWDRLGVRQVVHKGVKVNLYEFGTSLYSRTWGPGDCEEGLRYEGEFK